MTTRRTLYIGMALLFVFISIVLFLGITKRVVWPWLELEPVVLSIANVEDPKKQHLKRLFLSTKGVYKAVLDYDKNEVHIMFDRSVIDDRTLIRLFADKGYSIESVSAGTLEVMDFNIQFSY